ncbi:MAG: pyridoxal 5'-phosphate synthase glutaminase subunit PdxT [Rhodoluna sp.]
MGPIGVLALQGDFREHLAVLSSLSVATRAVKKSSDLEGLSGLVIPGGESTVIDKLSRTFELANPIRKLIHEGFPVFGTCAGLIMLADKVADGIEGQQTLGGLDVLVRRNAFGSQVDSFEGDVLFNSEVLRVAFIRAPIVEQVGSNVQVLSRLASGQIVAVRQGNLLGISFHPEITGVTKVHEYFVDMCTQANFQETN